MTASLDVCHVTPLRISRLAAGVITGLLIRDADARHSCLERQGASGICRLLAASSACIQLHGISALRALAACSTNEQPLAFGAAF